MTNTEPLFVIGAHKTGTSTLCGMLNCHPETLLLYELRMSSSQISRYGQKFLEAWPESRPLFRCRDDLAAPYLELADWLAGRGYRYRFVGDKLPGTDASLLDRLERCHVILTVRDLRAWLAKNSIIATYRTELDVVTPAIDYVRCLVNSYRHARCRRVRLEDLVRNGDTITDRLSSWLGCDLRPHLDGWWAKVGSWPPGDPKACLQWWKVHPSARLAPPGEDTRATTRPHPFWERVLPVFDKYFEHPEGRFDDREIEADLQAIERWSDLGRVPLADCYEAIESVCLHGGPGPGKLPAHLSGGLLTNEFKAHP